MNNKICENIIHIPLLQDRPIIDVYDDHLAFRLGHIDQVMLVIHEPKNRHLVLLMLHYLYEILIRGTNLLYVDHN